jgi:hypothetical protein
MPNKYLWGLLSTKCEGCGGTKKKSKSFCWLCFQALTGPLKGGLCRMIGDGYEKAYDEALEEIQSHWKTVRGEG